jgi:hypothetical protein
MIVDIENGFRVRGARRIMKLYIVKKVHVVKDRKYFFKDEI